MGSFSSVCAVSGIPIDYGNKIVGIKVVPTRFKDGGKYLYVPAGWPIFGEYDSYGGIEKHKDDVNHQDYAFIHESIWLQSHNYYHYRNSKGEAGWFNRHVKTIIEDALSDQKYSSIHSDWTFDDHLSSKIELRTGGYCDYHCIFNNLLFYSPRTIHAGEKQQYDILRARGDFQQILVQKIQNWDPADEDVLTKIIHLWSGQMITGHAIMPSGTLYIEQCPEYKQRIKVSKIHLDLLKKLNKKDINL